MTASNGLLSGEYFSVDGTLIPACASHKSVRREDGSDNDRPSGNWHGENSHASVTDPESKLYRKSSVAPAQLSYLGQWRRQLL